MDVDVYTSKDGSNYLATLAYMRPSIESGIDMSEFENSPERILGVKDPFVLESVLIDAQYLFTKMKPTYEFLTN